MSADSVFRTTIQVHGVSRDYLAGAGSCTAGVSALKSASVEIRGGEVLLVCGPVGAGKTTLLLCAAGMLHFDRGEVEAGIRPVIYRDLARGDWTIEQWPARAAILLDSCDTTTTRLHRQVTRGVAASLADGSAIVLAGRDPARCLSLVPDSATISIVHLQRGSIDGGQPGIAATHRVAEAGGGGY
jgi:ABC-type cobalamin/Fe3+-siderophores transport system ATPase subunit